MRQSQHTLTFVDVRGVGLAPSAGLAGALEAVEAGALPAVEAGLGAMELRWVGGGGGGGGGGDGKKVGIDQ